MSLSIKWPEIVKKFGPFIGGCENKLSDQNYNVRISTVKELDLSDVDPATNTDLSSAKHYDIFDLSNDLTLRGYFWYVTDPDIPAGVYMLQCHFKLRKKSTGTEYEDNRFMNGSNGGVIFSSGVMFGFYGRDYYGAPDFLLDDYKVKLCLLTEYSSTVVTDVTPADGFGIKLFAPSTNSTVVPGIQLWDHVSNGFSGYANERSAFEVVSNVADFYYPYSGAQYNVMYITDLSAFNTWVTGFDNTFDIDDIIDYGGEDDPVQEIDPSRPGGGGGNFDDHSDPIDFPGLPTGGALSSGAIKGFSVSNTILTNLFNVLWDTNIFDIATQFQKLVTNPLDCIISLHAIPLSPSVGSDAHIKLGSFDTEISAPLINNQYITVDCGALTVPEYWGSALDYNPYCKVSIFLPFVGIRDLNADDVINATIRVKYNFDVLTGDCVALVKCGQSVLYKFAGEAKQDIPVSGTTSNVLQKGLTAALSLAGGFAAGGAIGGTAGAMVGIASAASSVAGSKIVSQRSGSLAGNAGLLDEFVPYLILHRQIQSLAQNYADLKGYTSNITAVLNTLKGYTEVEHVHLDDINATDAEMNEIETLLKRGVII